MLQKHDDVVRREGRAVEFAVRASFGHDRIQRFAAASNGAPIGQMRIVAFGGEVGGEDACALKVLFLAIDTDGEIALQHTHQPFGPVMRQTHAGIGLVLFENEVTQHSPVQGGLCIEMPENQRIRDLCFGGDLQGRGTQSVPRIGASGGGENFSSSVGC